VGVVTVTAAVPGTPSLVAVIVGEPARTALTSPLPDTVAIAELLLAHVIGRFRDHLPAPPSGSR